MAIAGPIRVTRPIGSADNTRSPHHPHPGNRIPAAVKGCAQPVIPSGGRPVRAKMRRYRTAFTKPDRAVQNTAWTAMKDDAAAIQKEANPEVGGKELGNAGRQSSRRRQEIARCDEGRGDPRR